MAVVELYKLKKTVDPEVRDHGMFEFFGSGGPFSYNYVREWHGSLATNELADISGLFFLNMIDGHRGGALVPSDIITIDSEAMFLDNSARGYRFENVDFDTSEIKDAIHVEYGSGINMDEALYISQELAAICKQLEIPIGYLGEPGYHGSNKGISSFSPSSYSGREPCYLHPQFLKGADAQKFVDLLSELSKDEQWREIYEYLYASYPIYLSDMESARMIMLPVELREFAARIPSDFNKSELKYLAAKVRGLTDNEREVFAALLEAGWYCRNVPEIINLTENLEYFGFDTQITPADYGAMWLAHVNRDSQLIIDRLESSGDEAERALGRQISALLKCVDATAFGHGIAEVNGGIFTSRGLLLDTYQMQTVYHGIEDIPEEHFVAEAPRSNKPSVLDRIAAARAEGASVPNRSATDKTHKYDPREH